MEMAKSAKSRRGTSFAIGEMERGRGLNTEVVCGLDLDSLTNVGLYIAEFERVAREINIPSCDPWIGRVMFPKRP